MADNLINAQFAMGLTLKADTPTEQRILEYLEENASPILTAKINDGDKTLAGAFKYAHEQARKLLKDQKASGSQCVMVEDKTVFGWIMHFFEEDSIKQKAASRGPKLPKGGKVEVKAKPTPAPKAATNEELTMELFSEFKTNEGDRF